MTDTCPACVARGIQPTSERRHDGQIIHGYACRCGHRWATARLEETYPAAQDPACPTPEKHRYATREAAGLAAERTQVPFGRHLNTYQCRCGWFHNTKLADPARYNQPAA